MKKNFKSLLALGLIMGLFCSSILAQPGIECEECLTEPFDFVCVDDDGDIVLFPNACFAECAGYSPDDFVDCENDPGDPGSGCVECLNEPFDPVCVDDDGEVIPFPNACFAECEGYAPDDFVDCGGLPGGGFECEECLDEPFEPVCVEGPDGHLIPFPNACFAECEGFDPGDFVECDSICPGDPGSGFECEECLDEPFEPVCVDDDGEIIPFPNACFAECEGYTSDDFVDCDFGPGGPGNDCLECLDEPFIPVCVEDDDGNTIPFPNACFAECEGYAPDDFVECDSFPGGPGNDCLECLDEPFIPVCVEDDDGEIIHFPNACFAECEGYTSDDFVDCDFGPGGPGIDCLDCLNEPFEPVCVEDDDGNTIPFPNACFAECGGFTPDDFVECDSFPGGPGNDCLECFDEPFEPVCVDDDGEIIPFPNACFAECAGYDEADFVECDSSIICDPPTGNDCIECLNEPIEPVCVEDGGAIIAFPNACFAECAGYDETDIVTCDSLIGGGNNDYFIAIDAEELTIAVGKVNLVQNPVSDVLRLTLKSEENITTSGVITVLDLNGKVTSTHQVAIENGVNTYELDVQSLKPGIYLLQLRAGHMSQTLKFVK